MLVLISMLQLCWGATDEATDASTKADTSGSDFPSTTFLHDLNPDWIVEQLCEDALSGCIVCNGKTSPADVEKLLNWEVTGFSLGRKLMGDYMFAKLRTVSDDFVALFRTRGDAFKKWASGTLPNNEKLITECTYESWFIYVQVRDPSEHSKLKYVKICFASNRKHSDDLPAEIKDKVTDYLCKKDVLVRDGYHKALGSKTIKDYVAEGACTTGKLMIDVYEHAAFHRFETVRGGCKIVSLHDNPRFRNLSDVISVVRFTSVDGGKSEFPNYINPEYWGDGSFPLCNCMVYSMRVSELLGVEKNPAEWSPFEKKRGRVFMVSELEDEQIVFLDKYDGRFKLQLQDGEDPIAHKLNEDGEQTDVSVPITAFEINIGGMTIPYFKEIYKLPDTEFDIGHRKKGAPRLMFWAAINQAPLFGSGKGSRKRLDSADNPNSNSNHTLTDNGNLNRLMMDADSELYHKLMKRGVEVGGTASTFLFYPAPVKEETSDT